MHLLVRTLGIPDTVIIQRSVPRLIHFQSSTEGPVEIIVDLLQPVTQIYDKKIFSDSTEFVLGLWRSMAKIKI